MRLTPDERVELAALLGLNEQFLYQCLTGRNSMSAPEAARAERESGGRLTRRMLRTRDWWLIWPELVTDEHPIPTLAEQA
jgi:DNA-binding transcriptional regulator YdaS (Cro superfamily)